MKSVMQKVQYIILVVLFGFVAVAPAYAAPGFGGFFGRFFNRHSQDISEATSSPNPTFSPRNGFRADVRNMIGTKTGGLRPMILSRAAIGIGTVTAINGTTLTVLGKDGKTYTVQTDSTTQFRRLFWGKSSLSEISVNDQVSVIGKWTDDAHTTIQARLVRDVSIQKFAGIFFGTVQSLTSSGWVMTTINRGNETVTVSSTTKFTDRKGGALTQSSIAVGQKIRVRGLWDRTNSTITEVAAVKDFSLPPVPTGTAAPTPTLTVTPTATPTP